MFHFLDVGERKLRTLIKVAIKPTKMLNFGLWMHLKSEGSFVLMILKDPLHIGFENEEVVMKHMDMLSLFVFEIPKKVGNLYLPIKYGF